MESIQSSVTPQPSSEPDVSTNQHCPPPKTTQLGDIASPDEKLHPPQLVKPDDNWDMREYFQAKRRKLQDQFHDMGCAQSSIFEGVTIYVNGWTQPNADELKRMIHAHGGSYEYNLYSNPKITHTIATNLPNAKVKNLGDVIVCTPEWIVDSVTAGRQLPVDKYRLYAPSGGQKKLRFEKIQPKDTQHPHQPNAVCASTPKGIPALKQDESAGQEEGFSTTEVQPFQQQTTLRDDQTLAKMESENDGPEMSKSISDSCAALVPSVPNHPSPPTSLTSKEANFVNEFYSHSRLHHLSTWSTELKQFTAKMLHHIQPKYPKLPPGMSVKASRQRVVVHIDLDCFFVSVSIRNIPFLKGKPVAVAHAKLPKGNTTKQPAAESKKQHESAAMPQESAFDVSAESFRVESGTTDSADFSISTELPHLPKHLLGSMSDVASCSYEARKAGVRNGMSVGQALSLCPTLSLLPYEFDSYRKVSQTFYETLLLYSSVVEAVSCDEAYIELTDYIEGIQQAEKIVQELRDEVEAKTGCTVSAGIAHNMLLARMSTRVAKPNGQFHLPVGEVENFLLLQQVQDLPGVGYSLALKLREMGIETCGDLKVLSLTKLQTKFGGKTGQMLHDFARGIDSRKLKLTTERKSLSADINFGIRFSAMSEAESLILNLAKEVEKRAEEANVLGGTITLKLKIRRPDVPSETRKYLGHGVCNNVTRSCTLLQPSRSSSEIGRIAIRLLKQVSPAACDIRGVGIQLTKLVPSDSESEIQDGRAVARSVGGDLRGILKSQTSARSVGRSSGADVTSDPSLPNLVTQWLRDGLHSSHQGVHTKSITQHPGSGAADHVAMRPLHSGDESFSIDLPPASQLDDSVLEALPQSMKNKILQSYTEKIFSSMSDVVADKKPVDLNIASINTSLQQHSDDIALVPVLIPNVPHFELENESEFVQEFRKYIQDWVTSFIDGPMEDDLEKVTEYLVILSRTNLEIVSVTLLYFRRLIARLELKMWYPVFNSLLYELQTDIKCNYGGTLSVSGFK